MSIFAHTLMYMYRCAHTRVYILQTLALHGTVFFHSPREGILSLCLQLFQFGTEAFDEPERTMFGSNIVLL